MLFFYPVSQPFMALNKLVPIETIYYLAQSKCRFDAIS